MWSLCLDGEDSYCDHSVMRLECAACLCVMRLDHTFFTPEGNAATGMRLVCAKGPGCIRGARALRTQDVQIEIAAMVQHMCYASVSVRFNANVYFTQNLKQLRLLHAPIHSVFCGQESHATARVEDFGPGSTSELKAN